MAQFNSAGKHILPVTFPHLTRRMTLGGIGAAITMAGFRPARASSMPFPQRLVIVNLKGGLDGLSAVIPYTDSMLYQLRASLVPPAIGQAGGMLALDANFALNPALPNLYALYQSGQMLAVHAVGNILATRSHFADQTALQVGAIDGTTSGWMNRLIPQLTNYSGNVTGGVALNTAMPPIGQGQPPIGSFSNSPFANTPNTLAALVETLAVNDPLIGAPTQLGFFENSQYQHWLYGKTGKAMSPLQANMQEAGVFISSPGGPAVVVLDSGNMDTHTNQVSQLKSELADLDAGISLLANAAGSTWANTVVMTITEFGRSAAVNGCAGTDHGTGLAMFLAGGAVNGGRVLTPGGWPSLSDLWQGIDLKPTTDIRSVIMGVLQYHMQLSTAQLATVFPDLPGNVTPALGLVDG